MAVEQIEYNGQRQVRSVFSNGSVINVALGDCRVILFVFHIGICVTRQNIVGLRESDGGKITGWIVDQEGEQLLIPLTERDENKLFSSESGFAILDGLNTEERNDDKVAGKTVLFLQEGAGGPSVEIFCGKTY